jgi:hypothetical protein
MTKETKPTTSTAPKQTGPQFIPKLKGKKVTIRLVPGGQPISGILEGYNPYEILIQTVKGQVLVRSLYVFCVKRSMRNKFKPACQIC